MTYLSFTVSKQNKGLYVVSFTADGGGTGIIGTLYPCESQLVMLNAQGVPVGIYDSIFHLKTKLEIKHGVKPIER